MGKFIALKSVERAGWCVYLDEAPTSVEFWVGPLKDQAHAESEAKRLNKLNQPDLIFEEWENNNEVLHEIGREIHDAQTKGRPLTPARGESMPQTQEYWEKRAAMDQELILEQRDEINKLKQKINQMEQER